MATSWQSYEELARHVVFAMREALGIASVEGKQVLPGMSGTEWEIDAKAWLEGGEGFLVVEARRHTDSGVKQEAVAAIAYRIHDVGALGGVIVSPLPLQSGAAAVADFEGISHVRLAADSTAERYLAEFMGRRFIGVTATDSLHLTDSTNANTEPRS